MKVRKWTHPDLDQPIYLTVGACAPVEYLKQTSHRGLFQSEVMEITTEEYDTQDLKLLFSEEDLAMEGTVSEHEVEEALQSEIAPQLKVERRIEVPAKPKVRSPKPPSLSRRIGQELLDAGADYGSIFPTVQLEQALGCTRDTVRFQFAMCVVRSLFLEQGMYLTARGQEGEQYVVLEANQNVDVMHSFSKKTISLLGLAVTLGTNTDRTDLSAQEKRRLDSRLEKAAHRQALMGNSEQIVVDLTKSNSGFKLVTAS